MISTFFFTAVEVQIIASHGWTGEVIHAAIASMAAAEDVVCVIPQSDQFILENKLL